MPWPSDLDAAVQDFARRFRAALDPPAQAGVTIGRAELAARFDEPLPEHGRPARDDPRRARGALRRRARRRHRRPLLRLRHGRVAAGRSDRRGVDGGGRPEPGHVAARRGRGRARAGDDPLARRSARSPGRLGLLRLGRDDGEHRRPRGRTALVRAQARRRRGGAGRARAARVRRLRLGGAAPLRSQGAAHARPRLGLRAHHPDRRPLRDARGPARRGDRARPGRRRRARDRDRDGRLGQHRRLRLGRGDRRRLRAVRPVAARRRRVRRVLPALGAAPGRSSPGSSAPTRWRSTATSGSTSRTASASCC